MTWISKGDAKPDPFFEEIMKADQATSDGDLSLPPAKTTGLTRKRKTVVGDDDEDDDDLQQEFSKRTYSRGPG